MSKTSPETRHRPHRASLVFALLGIGLVTLAGIGRASPTETTVEVSLPRCLPYSASWSVDGDAQQAQLGYAVSTAGDVDGDGYDDILVGSPMYEGAVDEFEGAACVYYGPMAGPNPSDRFSMVVGGEQGEEYGWAVSSAGDVNNDGYDDVLVGAPEYRPATPKCGRADLYFGSATGLITTTTWILVGEQCAQGDQLNERMGYAVSSAGDVDNNGYDDFLIASPGYSQTLKSEGRVQAFYGSAGEPDMTADWVATGGQEFALLGRSVAGAGDVNNDGYDDVVIGAPGYDLPTGEDDAGLVWLYYGTAAGLSATPAWTVTGVISYTALGAAVSSAGDVNNDNFDDLIISAPRTSDSAENSSTAYLYLGSAGGPASTPAWSFTFTYADLRAVYVMAVAGAGDVNKDGFDDVIIGAPAFGVTAIDQPEEGIVWLFPGWSNGLRSAVCHTSEGNKVSARYGLSVASAGDTDADGAADVLIGAPGYNLHDDQFVGRAFLFLGREWEFAYLPLARSD